MSQHLHYIHIIIMLKQGVFVYIYASYLLCMFQFVFKKNFDDVFLINMIMNMQIFVSVGLFSFLTINFLRVIKSPSSTNLCLASNKE